jgi:hypothetical protein
MRIVSNWYRRGSNEPDTPSGAHVLAQVSTDRTDYRFPVAVALTLLVRDASVSVQCKMVSGEVDQACGLVVHYQDERHYYVTRANALEQNVRFYKVVDGTRQQLASWEGAVMRGVWTKTDSVTSYDDLRVELVEP